MNKVTSRLHDFFYSSNRAVKISSRLAAVTIISVTAYGVIPAIADELASAPLPPALESTTQTDQPIPASAAPSVIPSTTISESPSDAPSPAPSDSPSEEAIPKLLDPQPGFTYRIPSEVAIDPRAGILILPRLAFFGGGENGILCVTGNAIFDVGQKNFSNNSESQGLKVVGDFTSRLIISGNAAALNSVINSGNGLRVISNQGHLAYTGISFSYAGITLPSTDPTFCGQAPYRASIFFRPLGLQMDTVKTKVEFKKP